MFKHLFNNIFLYTLKIIHFVFIFNLFYINWFSSFARRAFVVTQPSSLYCYLKSFEIINEQNLEDRKLQIMYDI